MTQQKVTLGWKAEYVAACEQCSVSTDLGPRDPVTNEYIYPLDPANYIYMYDYNYLWNSGSAIRSFWEGKSKPNPHTCTPYPKN